MLDIVRFEWRYHTRQLSFALAILGFLLFGFMLMSTGFGPDTVRLSAPWLVAEAVAFLSLLSVFALAIFASSGIVRDTDHRMTEILYSTPVGKAQYLGGRFIGAFLAGVTVFSASLIGMAVASQMPWQDPARSAPLSLLAYLWAFVVMALPNLLFTAALLFAIAAITRSTIASAVGAVAIYVLYFISASLTNSPLMAAARPGQAGGLQLAALLDPFGLSAFFAQTHYWTIAQQNVQFPSLSGAFLANRIAVLVASAILVAMTIRLFSFRSARVTRRPAAIDLPVATDAISFAPPTAPSGSFNDRSVSLAAFRRAALLEVNVALRSRPFQILLTLFAALLASEVVSEIRGNEYGSALLPATTILLATLHDPLSLVGMLVIVYFSGEIMWRERKATFVETLAATPAPGGVFVAAKWTALAVMALLLCAIAVALCGFVQLYFGYSDLQVHLYASVLLFEALPLLLVAAAAVFLHTVSPNRHVGMLLTLVIALFTRQGGLGVEHHLIRFATAPRATFSGMNGLGRSVEPFLWFMAYWGCLALAMLLVASRLWRRDMSRGARGMLHQLRAQAMTTPAVCLLAFIACGAWIFYNTNVRNDYESTGDVLSWRIDYERNYAVHRDATLPRVEAVRTNVALFPEERRATIAGEYTLRNDSQHPVRTLLVALRRDARDVRLMLDGNAPVADARFGMYTFSLDEPLAPGARAELRFSFALSQRGFANDPPDYTIAGNGSFIWSFLHFPLLGYRESYETDDARAREVAGLPVRAESTDAGGDDHPRPALDWIRYDATVSTSADQLAVSQGKLVRQWRDGDRNHFHYRADAPMTNIFSFHSARFAVRKAQQGSVAIEVYHHPTHDMNVDRIIRASQQSLAHMEETLSAYPLDHLRVIEVPSYSRFAGFAMAGTILMNEGRGFLTDSRDPGTLDVVSRRIAHEVVHQWWGHGVSAARAPGSSTITESLTKLGELEIIEKMYGREHVRRSLEFELDRYLKSRSARAEDPLLTVEAQPGVYYGKGAVVMMAVRDLLGRERLHAALRAFFAANAGPARGATATDLLAELQRVAPEHRAVLDDWFTRIVLYDFKINAVSVSRRPDGHDVIVDVTASRSVSNDRGDEQPLPFDEEIAFAVYARTANGALDLDHPHVEKVRLKSGVNQITLRVPGAPSMVAVDPYITRVDRSPFDNSKSIE